MFKKTLWIIIGLPIRTILRIIRDIDGALMALTNRFFSTQYTLTGTCRKRGICCQNIAVYLSPSFWRFQHLKRLAIFWYECVYCFRLKSEKKEWGVIIFHCTYLQKNGHCGIYKKRPMICRQYPAPRYFGRPEILPGCGYSFKLRSAHHHLSQKRS